MKNNKFKKATSIVMSAVVASMAMGSGACYAAQTKLDTAKTKLDEAKKRVESTTSQFVKDGRKFVNKVSNDVSNNVSNRDVLFFTAGSCTAAAIALGTAYYGYPNGLEDLAKHIVEVNVGEGKLVKLLALHLKNYNFGEGKTADALLLISTDPRKAVAASEEGMADEDEEKAETEICSVDGQKIGVDSKKASWIFRTIERIFRKTKPSDGRELVLEVNKVYRATSENELAFKQLMDRSVSEAELRGVHVSLKVVKIDALYVFGGWRNVERNEINQELANGLISKIEDSAKLSKRKLGFFSFGNGKEKVKVDVKEDVKKVEPKESKKFVVGAYAVEPIAAGTKSGTEVNVRFAEDDETSDPMKLGLAKTAGKEIKVGDPVQVIVKTEEYQKGDEEGTYTFKFGGKEFKNVKEAAAEN